MPVCGEICYECERDGVQTSVHSDVCPPNHNIGKADESYRSLMHDCLDEWMNKSGGTGYFFLGAHPWFVTDGEHPEGEWSVDVVD